MLTHYKRICNYSHTQVHAGLCRCGQLLFQQEDNLCVVCQHGMGVPGFSVLSVSFKIKQCSKKVFGARHVKTGDSWLPKRSYQTIRAG